MSLWFNFRGFSLKLYKGKLDDRQVAIKVKGPLSPWSFEKTINFFLDQVAIKQLFSHKNVLRLYGCWLEAEIPMLVFELISNSTLFDNLHGKGKWVPCMISWLDRVRIAMETSYAICYMHCGRSRPIVHLDIKSSEFQGNSVEGTFGYVDPEYQETLRVTKKCDVYNFGVVLVEVFTGQNPSKMLTRHMNLVDDFVSLMEENCVLQIIDDVVLTQGSNEDIQAFSELALRCVKNKGNERLTMKEVTLELMRIQNLVRPKQNNRTVTIVSAQTWPSEKVHVGLKSMLDILKDGRELESFG
nr:wall-associated receptor kinase 3 [Quercus suber]